MTLLSQVDTTPLLGLHWYTPHMLGCFKMWMLIFFSYSKIIKKKFLALRILFVDIRQHHTRDIPSDISKANSDCNIKHKNNENQTIHNGKAWAGATIFPVLEPV